MIDVNAQNVVEVSKKLAAGEIPAPAKSLAEAMHRVMQHVGYIQKKGTVTVGQGYKFAGEAQFIEAIRPELVAQQIVVCPVAMEPLVNEQFPNSSGKPQNRIVLRVTFRFTHAPTGQFLDVQTCGEGIDNGDKATNKAMTGAMKYALRQSFVIETGNDPDETPNAQQERVAPPKVEPAKPAVADNPGRRAAFAQKFAQCQNREQFLSVCNTLKADVNSALLSENDRLTLRKIAEETAARFPATKA